MSGLEELYSHIKACVPDQLALLRELHIEMRYYSVDANHMMMVPSLNIFNNAPLLQEVVANKLSWRFPVTMVLPWSQLLRYGGSNTWDDHLLALHSATNLVDCSLEIQLVGISAPPPTPILLPHLLRLALSHPEFLECLETPALLELYCDYAAPVLPFLRRQSCKLQKLVMWECPTPPPDTDLTRIVDAVPTVRTLALDFILPTDFAYNLCSRPDLAPALEFLPCVRLGFSWNDRDETQNHFMQAVELRWQAGRLKSVKAEQSGFMPNILERFALLQAQGMEFVVSIQDSLLLREVVPPKMWIETEA